MTALPADVLLDHKVEALIADGYPLPRWGFPTPAAYNGATGAERIRVWQKNNIAWQIGLMPDYPDCSICEAQRAQGWHQEIYFRAFAVKPVCRSCHARVHRRFGNPQRWKAFTDRLAPGNWAKVLLTEQLEREEAQRLALEPDWLRAFITFAADRQATR